MTDTSHIPEPIDGSMVHALSRHWKPTKQQTLEIPEAEPIRIRIHRCLSWMQRVENINKGEDQSLDDALIFQWVALNSLYGRWDPNDRCPVNDQDSLDAFLERVLAADTDGLIESMLKEHRKLVISIVEDEYLNKYYWEDPTDQRAKQARNTKFKVRSWYVEGKPRPILDRLLERIYLARCQLVHGAATHGS